MEHAIGEKFKVNGCVYVAVEDLAEGWTNSCAQCVLCDKYRACNERIFGECDNVMRSDKKSVHFELVDSGTTATGERGGE